MAMTNSTEHKSEGDHMTATIPPRPGPRRRWRRLGLIGIAAFACAAPAVAAVQPWQSAQETPPATASGDPGAVARDALSVIGRPQTDADRAFAPALTKGANAQLQDPDMGSLRAVGGGAAVIAAKLSDPVRGITEQVCLIVGDLTGCASAGSFPATGLQVRSANGDGVTRVVGLVPDGVAKVRFVPTDGPAVTAPVTNNHYSLKVVNEQPALTPTSVSSPVAGAPTTPPPTPVTGTAEWLDRSGAVVGPKA